MDLRNQAVDAVSEHAPLLGNGSGEPLYKDNRPWVKWPAQTLHITWLTLISNPVNVLLVFVPLGIIAGVLGWSPAAVFTLNFFAIVPLASLLSFATEELSCKLGQTIGGLLNATFGNAVELIVSRKWTRGRLEKGVQLTGSLGQYRRFKGKQDSHRAVKHAWIHTFKHPSGSRMLFSCWRNQA